MFLMVSHSLSKVNPHYKKLAKEDPNTLAIYGGDYLESNRAAQRDFSLVTFQIVGSIMMMIM